MMIGVLCPFSASGCSRTIHNTMDLALAQTVLAPSGPLCRHNGGEGWPSLKSTSSAVECSCPSASQSRAVVGGLKHLVHHNLTSDRSYCARVLVKHKQWNAEHIAD